MTKVAKKERDEMSIDEREEELDRREAALKLLEAMGVKVPQPGVWMTYVRRKSVEMRPYEEGEDLSNVEGGETAEELEGGMIARVSKHYTDAKQWFVPMEELRRDYEV